MPTPRPAMEVCSRSLEPGPTAIQPASCPLTGCTQQTEDRQTEATDVRQHYSLMPLGGGIIMRTHKNTPKVNILLNILAFSETNINR